MTVRVLETSFAAAALMVVAGGASAHEVCRFVGTTDHSGRIAVVTDVATAGFTTTVDVRVEFEAAPMLWPAILYRAEELSTWRAGELERVAVNNRYFAGGHVVRQQWDEFERGADRMEARRVQAKSLAELAYTHPSFVRHWDVAAFGVPWLTDYWASSPERRPDLDGSPLSPGLRTPLAMAFYWVRSLPNGGQEVPVFLPGFKARQVVRLPITSAAWAGGLVWETPLRYPALKERPVSTATAWTSTDGHLLQLAFELHSWSGSARGLIHQGSCDGSVAPVAAQ